MAALSSSALIKQLEAVHLAFQAGAIERLYPNLGPEERERAVKREQQRDGAFTANMRARITAGAQAIRQERGLTAQERDLRLAQLAALEVRYLRMHVAAASWRLQSEADISRLKAQGEDGAYWELNPGLLTHTEDCLRMAGRWWPWRVLDKINPANRHSGCGCVLLGRRDAERKGHEVVLGRHTPSVARHSLNEAARLLALELIREGENGLARTAKVDGPARRSALLEATAPAEPPAISNGSPKRGRRKREDKRERDDAICEAWNEQGMSQSAIGRQFGLSQPRIRAILIARYGQEALKARGKAGTRHDLAAMA